MKSFFFNYNKFTLRSKLLFYGVHIGESFIAALIVGFLFFNQSETDLLIFIAIPVILTPIGILFVGGFDEIKKRFMLRHKLQKEDF